MGVYRLKQQTKTALLFAVGSLYALYACSEVERAPRDDLSNVLVSCNTSVADLAALSQQLCALQQKVRACASIPLYQVDIPAVLSVDDQVYCLAEKVIGDITINGDDITVNLNDHTLNGRIIINGARAIVRNGSIIGPDPSNNTQAQSGILVINGADAEILNVTIGSQDSTLTGVDGNHAVIVNGENVLIQTSTIQAGNAANVNGVANGGSALFLLGTRPRIQDCQVYGGAGSDSNDGTITVGNGGRAFFIQSNVDGAELLSSVFYAGDAGTLNTSNDISGIVLGRAGENRSDGTNLIIRNCKIYGGNSQDVQTTGGNIGDAGGAVTFASGTAGLALVGSSSNTIIQDSDIRGGAISGMVALNIGTLNSVTQGTAGQGIYVEGRLLLKDSLVMGGPAGVISVTGTIGAGGAVTLGGNGRGLEITSTSSRALVQNSTIIASSASSVSAGAIATGSNVSLGAGADGIVSNGVALLVNESIILGGNSSAVNVTLAPSDIGSVAGQLIMHQGGNGVLILSGGKISEFKNCIIRAGNVSPINATNNINNVVGSFAGTGLAIGHASSSTLAAQSLVLECEISGGSALDITGGGSIAASATVTASNGGRAIDLFANTSSDIYVANCTLTAGRGGDVIGVAGGLARTGGNALPVIDIRGSNLTGIRIIENYVTKTGRGGNAAGAAGTGGNGGTGLSIGAGVTSAEISKNTIAYTGVGGTGAVSGTSGQAINSLSLSSGMTIYGNFVHTIANPTPLNILAGNVDGSVTGTAYAAAAGTNFLFNIHNP